MSRFAFDAFVSYAHADVEFTRKLVDWLRRAEFRVWLDEEEMSPGERFREIIQKGVRTSQHLIAVLSPEYTRRQWTQREVDLFDLPASQRRRRILAVTLDEVEKGRLDQVFLVHQRIEWRGRDFDPEAFWTLYCGLRDLKPGPQKLWAREGRRLIRRQVAQPSPRVRHPGVEGNLGQAQAQVAERVAEAVPVVARAAARSTLHDAPGAWEWAGVGPTNIGGRATSLVCHPTRPDVVWLGTAAGGVWKSADAGRSWRALWHKQESLAIGSLAIDPSNLDVLYCGTGEANMASDCAPGVGMYRTDDSGLTWRLLASAKEQSLPLHIGAVTVDPFDSRHIYLGGVDLGGSNSAGLFVSYDGGASWRREGRVSPAAVSCHVVMFHPSREGVVLAVVEDARGAGGIWRSVDGGQSWIHVETGLPEPKSFGRASLAVAPSKPEVVYAVVADPRGGVLGIFRSSDMGARWRRIALNPVRDEVQAFYNNALAVHPHDHRRVLWGGYDVYLTKDGGAKWRQATQWHAELGSPRFAHASHHVLVVPAAAPERVYDANDGGLDVSEDGGATWSNRSRGLAITMFNRIAVARTDSRRFGGGTRGLGTLVTTTGRPDDHVEVLGGNGGWMAFDPERPHEVYASHQWFGLYRIAKRGIKNISPPVPEHEQGSIWLAATVMSPEDASVLFTGSDRVWRTSDGGTRWEPVSQRLDGSAVSTIEVAAGNGKRVYVGTAHGGIFRSLDGGNSWSQDLGAKALPNAWVSSVKTSPTDADVVFITLGSTGHSHVFRSEDGGLTWADIDKERLPDAACTAIALPRADARRVYVSSDAGVFVSTDRGDTWQRLSGNLPNTLISDIVYHDANGALYAGTYGRSIWRLQVQ
ncbi:MAG TPA: TIR domain-containing protein [Blastocatellia bacterium]|nr:TIR domain-containing protein [Blastocatellia bacterium]